MSIRLFANSISNIWRRLLRISPPAKDRVVGTAAGEIWIGPDFNDLLPDELFSEDGEWLGSGSLNSDKHSSSGP